jgi:hypothetical protein
MALRRLFGLLLINQTGVQVGVDGKLFAGMASSVKRAATSATRPHPVDHRELDDHEDQKITMPTT